MTKNFSFYLEAFQCQPASSETVRASAEQTLPAALCAQAQTHIRAWQHYEPTAMHALPALAKHYGLHSLHCKDEGTRFGLGSFKALGGAYAVSVFAKQDGITVACATEGNHGRSVAWGAQQAGVDCVIFLHEGVSHTREMAIRQYGAQIVRVPGNYDDAVRECARVSEEHQWQIISDTSWENYQEIPRYVMAGYSLIAQETQAQLEQAPTHVFLQGGVGGIAAAMIACLERIWPEANIRYIIVEPRRAACLQDSAKAGGTLRSSSGPFNTIMAGLACGEPSAIVLDLIYQRCELYLALDDEAIKEAMIQYARPMAQDPKIVAGASGAAGLAGLLSLLKLPSLCSRLQLKADSRVLVLNTENNTDPTSYQSIVGTL